MATNATRTQPAKPPAPAAALAADPGLRKPQTPSSPSDVVPKAIGYGLPCAKCHLYYPADLDTCPTCKHKERVSPVVARRPPSAAQATTEAVPDTAVVEHEREEFLKQFKSQLLDVHAQVANTAGTICTQGPHAAGDSAEGEVCKACYEKLQERLDVFEASLHIDLKEAAQLIYDAVWADPSDPNKTYQNAASALLAELRKRAGMNSVMSPFQPLSD